MYQQIILDHYKHPQHHGLPDDFDAEVHHVNPTCGDEVTLRVTLADGTVAELGWDGEGCSISQASTSVMSELVVGKPVDEALALQRKFLELMQSRGKAELTEADEEELEDAVAFEGVSKYPARVKCALLGWMAMKSAVAEAGWHDRGDTHDRTRHRPLPSRDEIDEAMRDVVDPELGHQRRRPRPRLRRARRARPTAARHHARHDADVRGLPAHRRHRGPDATRR